MATKTPFYPTPTGKLTGNLVALNAPKPKTPTPYFVPSPTGLPTTPSQVSFLSGSRGSSPTPFYPTPTGAPITISAGGGGGVPTVLGATTSYAPQIPTTISSKSLGGTSPAISLPSYSSYAPSTISSTPGGTSNYSFDMSSLLTPDLAGQGYKIENNQLIAPATSEQKQPELKGVDKYLAKFKELLPKPEKKADLYKQAEIDAGIQAKQNAVNTYASQLNSITANRDAQLLQLRGIGAKEGVTENIYGGQQLEVNREAAIRALPIAAQLSAAQGDLATAQTHLDKYFGIISDDIDAQYKYQTDLISSVFSYADKAEQRLLTDMKDQKDKEWTLKRDAINQANDIAKTALANGQGSLYSQITALNPSDPQYTQKVAQLGGQVKPKIVGQEDAPIINSIYSQLTNAKGSDGYTDPNLYSKLRASSIMSPTEFDNRFGDMVNPESRNKLGLGGTASKTLNQEQLGVINDAKSRIDYGKQRYEDVPALRAAIIQQELQSTGFDLSSYI